MEPWLEFPESYGKFPLAIYMTHGNAYVSLSIPPTLSFFPPPSHVPKSESIQVRCFFEKAAELGK